jgi:hypothetical protein
LGEWSAKAGEEIYRRKSGAGFPATSLAVRNPRTRLASSGSSISVFVALLELNMGSSWMPAGEKLHRKAAISGIRSSAKRVTVPLR